MQPNRYDFWKKGEVPQPETFESVSVFLCDIVGFTTLSSESTAHQIVDMLNLLYNMYDSRIDAYDVYKVFDIFGLDFTLK